jgi:chromosome segregation ATPase
MKAALVILGLGLICAVLVYALFQRGALADARFESFETNQVALSNQIVEARTRLTLAEVTAEKATSNLQRSLDKRTSDLNVVSNRLVQAHLLLQAARNDTRSLHEQLQNRVARVALLENENAQLSERIRRPGEVETVAKERDSLRRELTEAQRERDALQTRLGALHVEKETLQSQLFDVEFLDRQRKDAETAADIRRRMSTTRAGATADPRANQELQPDGTVRYVGTNPGK